MSVLFSMIGIIFEVTIGKIIEIIFNSYIKIRKPYGLEFQIKPKLGVNGRFISGTYEVVETYGFIIDVINYTNFDIEVEDIMAECGELKLGETRPGAEIGTNQTIKAKSAKKAIVVINQAIINKYFSACSSDEKIYITVNTPITTYKKYTGFTAADLINKYQEYIKANNKK